MEDRDAQEIREFACTGALVVILTATFVVVHVVVKPLVETQAGHRLIAVTEAVDLFIILVLALRSLFRLLI